MDDKFGWVAAAFLWGLVGMFWAVGWPAMALLAFLAALLGSVAVLYPS